MEIRKVRSCDREKSKCRAERQEQGFALLSLIALVPLLFSVVAVLATTFMALKRKSLAQSLCVQSGMQLQVSLKAPLKKLLQLNPQAQRLRIARMNADQNLASATSTGYPPAIAAATAAQQAVILQQVALQTSQRLLLGEAQALRIASSRELDVKLRGLSLAPVRTLTFYSRALAVRPTPVNSLSPNYETIPMFTTGQQQRFSFDVNILAQMPFSNLSGANQKSECSVSLKESEGEWKIQVVAAKAP